MNRLASHYVLCQGHWTKLNCFLFCVAIPLVIKLGFQKFFNSNNVCLFPFFMYPIVVFTWEMCNSVDIKVCKLENSPTHHFSTSPDDFYRQNWPFLLLDTSLNVQLCQHPLFLSLNFSLKILHIKRGRKKTPKWMF